MTQPDYPRPGAWRDDPAHAQTLCELLERGAPEQLRDIEDEAMRAVGQVWDVAIDPATNEEIHAAYQDGYRNGTEDGKHDAKTKETK